MILLPVREDELVCRLRHTTMFDLRHILSKAHVSNDGLLDKPQLRRLSAHARSPTFLINSHLTLHAQTHIIPCQHTHPVPSAIMVCLHRMFCSRRIIISNRMDPACSRPTTNRSISKCHDHFPRKDCSACFKATLIDMEDVLHISQTFQTHLTYTLPSTRNRRTRQSQI